jgi:hypothetical protein
MALADYVKWAIIGTISIFGMYLLYEVAKGQGWIAGARTRRMRLQELAARRRG